MMQSLFYIMEIFNNSEILAGEIFLFNLQYNHSHFPCNEKNYFKFVNLCNNASSS